MGTRAPPEWFGRAETALFMIIANWQWFILNFRLAGGGIHKNCAVEEPLSAARCHRRRIRVCSSGFGSLDTRPLLIVKRRLFNSFLTGQRESLSMTRDDLEHLWAWANDKLATGEQPPWAWEQYVKLCEMLDVISARMAGSKVSGSSRYTQRQSAHLRLIANSVNSERRPARPSF